MDASQSRTSRCLRVGLLALAVLLVADAALEADLRKRMRRRFPDGWFPIPMFQYDLTFRASGPNATVTFEAFDLLPAPGESAALCLDNVAIADRQYFRAHQEIGSGAESTGCSGSRLPQELESYFAFPGDSQDPPTLPGAPEVPFLDTFVENPADRWQGLNGTVLQWRAGADALYKGNGACLGLGEPDDDEAAASFSVDNLVAGTTYVLTGWWWISADVAEPPTIDVTISGDVFERSTVLLVDDDDDSPDVRSLYTEALDRIGVGYTVHDSGAGDLDPAALKLSKFRTVVWFSGDKHQLGGGPGVAGPSSCSPAPCASGETDLQEFLDQGGCLILSSQEVLKDRGGSPTTFMEDYLGLDSGSEAGQNDATGKSGDDFFGGLGTYALVYPGGLANSSDALVPDLDSSVAFVGDQGDAAIYKQVPASDLPEVIGHRTAYLGFPLAAIESLEERVEALAALLKLCDLTCPRDCDPEIPELPYHRSFGVESVSTSQTACHSLFLEGTTLEDGAGLEAGDRVVLGNGVSTADGASVVLGVGPVDQ